MKAQTKEEIFAKMREKMPFHIRHEAEPYILEAMELYKNQPAPAMGYCSCDAGGQSKIVVCSECKKPVVNNLIA